MLPHRRGHGRAALLATPSVGQAGVPGARRARLCARRPRAGSAARRRPRGRTVRARAGARPAISAARVRQHHRVGLRVRGARGADDGLADRMVDGDPGAERRRSRPAAAPRATSSRPAGRAEPGGDELRGAQRGQLGHRVGQRRVEGLHRRGRGRSSRSPPAGPRREAISAGSATTSAGRTSRAPQSRPACDGRGSSRRRTGWSGRRRSGPPPPRDRLGGVDHAAAAQRHRRALAGPLEQRAEISSTLPAGT